ncbi:MAG: hypothetical protein JXA15_05230 [Spirochaetales bacterium]|nr:hypothetical protein [Spirochaetales bacterium]
MRRSFLPLVLGLMLVAAASGQAVAPFTFKFPGGDSLSGELAGLSASALKLKPAIAPTITLEVPLSKVSGFFRASIDALPPRTDLDVLVLRDGARLNGRFSGVESGTVRFDAEGVGAVRLPLDLVESLVRNGNPSPARLGATDRSQVTTRSGSVLFGNLAAEGASTIVVSGLDVSSRLSVDAVASILFPEPQTPAAPYPKGVIVANVELANGSVLSGTNAELKGGQLVFQLAGKQSVSIPLISVAGVTFGETGAFASSKQILLWSAFADLSGGGERDNTRTVLADGLGSSWKIVELENPDISAEFKAKLFASRALVIPEPENFDADPEELGLALKPLLADYLSKGGTVIILGATGSSLGMFGTAGLVELGESNSIWGEEFVTWTASAPAAYRKGIDAEFPSLNATYLYSVDPSTPAATLAEYEGGAAILLRKVGRGRVVVMGFDFYEIKDGAARALVNAVLAE